MLPSLVQKLIEHFAKLPGIGPKTAQRLVLYLVKSDPKILMDFGQSLINLKEKVINCQQCGQLSEKELCEICRSPRRDKNTICLVAEESDIISLEKSGIFNGLYHVLNGLLSPTEGMTPDKLNIKKLEERIKLGHIKEIIFALNPTIEGETTSLYLANYLKKYNVLLSKLARGLPQGANLEYADEVTLTNALKNRTKV